MDGYVDGKIPGHIPGYRGHITKMTAENYFGTTYGKLTGKVKHGRDILPDKQRHGRYKPNDPLIESFYQCLTGDKPKKEYTLYEL